MLYVACSGDLHSGGDRCDQASFLRQNVRSKALLSQKVSDRYLKAFSGGTRELQGGIMPRRNRVKATKQVIFRL